MFEFSEVVVGEYPQGGTAHAGAVDEAGVAELVEDDGIALLHEGGDGSD